jgi:zinc transporter ZupT
LISFAIGGLLGDVFFHTLPHLNSGHSHDVHANDDHHNHDHVVGLNEHTHSHDEAGHGHTHNAKEMCNNSIIIMGIIIFFLIEKVTKNYLGGGHDHSSHTHDNKKAEKEHTHSPDEREIRYKSYVIISLIGDFLHNFTDGLSIGVAYVASNTINDVLIIVL